ncbi:MAG: AAA family ATPase [Bacteroidales bacterium]|nr:AAA family ATPase [Bacteroidales bacterium]
MAKNIFRLSNEKEYNAAGPSNLIVLEPVKGKNQIFVQKATLEILAYSIYNREFIHLSGPTGSAKSSLVEALTRNPDNFRHLCKYLKFPLKEIVCFEIEMALFDTPAELYQRRSLKDGHTYDEPSVLTTAMKKCVKLRENQIPLIFLKEMGRVHTASIQGGLLNLMTKSDIYLPSGDTIPGDYICFLADSNYQAAEDSQHTLVTFDTALKRRFPVNVLLDYLTKKEEWTVTEHILKQEDEKIIIDNSLLEKVIELGTNIRQYQSEGNLLSVVPPTIYGYLTCYKMAKALTGIPLETIVSNTLLGNATRDDNRMTSTLIQNVVNSAAFTGKDAFMDSVF